MLAAPATTAIPLATPFDMGAGAWSLAPITGAASGVRVASARFVVSAGSDRASAVVWTSATSVALRGERGEDLTGEDVAL